MGEVSRAGGRGGEGVGDGAVGGVRARDREGAGAMVMAMAMARAVARKGVVAMARVGCIVIV